MLKGLKKLSLNLMKLNFNFFSPSGGQSTGDIETKRVYHFDEELQREIYDGWLHRLERMYTPLIGKNKGWLINCITYYQFTYIRDQFFYVKGNPYFHIIADEYNPRSRKYKFRVEELDTSSQNSVGFLAVVKSLGNRKDNP